MDGDAGAGSGTLSATGDAEADERRKRTEERMEKRKAEEVRGVCLRCFGLAVVGLSDGGRGSKSYDEQEAKRR